MKTANEVADVVRVFVFVCAPSAITAFPLVVALICESSSQVATLASSTEVSAQQTGDQALEAEGRQAADDPDVELAGDESPDPASSPTAEHEAAPSSTEDEPAPSAAEHEAAPTQAEPGGDQAPPPAEDDALPSERETEPAELESDTDRAAPDEQSETPVVEAPDSPAPEVVAASEDDVEGDDTTGIADIVATPSADDSAPPAIPDDPSPHTDDPPAASDEDPPTPDRDAMPAPIDPAPPPAAPKPDSPAPERATSSASGWVARNAQKGWFIVFIGVVIPLALWLLPAPNLGKQAETPKPSHIEAEPDPPFQSTWASYSHRPPLPHANQTSAAEACVSEPLPEPSWLQLDATTVLLVTQDGCGPLFTTNDERPRWRIYPQPDSIESTEAVLLTQFRRFKPQLEALSSTQTRLLPRVHGRLTLLETQQYERQLQAARDCAAMKSPLDKLQRLASREPQSRGVAKAHAIWSSKYAVRCSP